MTVGFLSWVTRSAATSLKQHRHCTLRAFPAVTSIEAWQSHHLCPVLKRLLRHCIPRNDGWLLSRVTRSAAISTKQHRHCTLRAFPAVTSTVARQSHHVCPVLKRLLRHCVPRNDGWLLSRVTRSATTSTKQHRHCTLRAFPVVTSTEAQQPL